MPATTEAATPAVRRVPRKLNAAGASSTTTAAPKAPVPAKATPVKPRTPLGTVKKLPTASTPASKPATVKTTAAPTPSKMTPVTATKTTSSSASKPMPTATKKPLPTAIKKDTSSTPASKAAASNKRTSDLTPVEPKPVSTSKPTTIKKPAPGTNVDGKSYPSPFLSYTPSG